MGILPVIKGGHIESFGGSATRSFPHIDEAGMARYNAVESRSDAALDTYHQTSEIQQSLADEKAALASYIARANGSPDPRELSRLQERVDRQNRRLRTHHELTHSAVAVGHAMKVTRDICLKFLNTNGERRFVSAPVEVPKSASYESLTSKVEELGADIRAAEEAWPPLDDALRDARARIESEAARGAPRASVDVQSIGNPMRPVQRAVLNLHWPQEPLAAAPLNGDELLTTFDGVAAMCFLHKDAVIAKLEADLKAAYKGYTGPTLTEAERRQRVRELKTSRLQVERQLAALVWSRIDAGDVLVTFPAEMAPEAVMEIAAR